MKVILNKYEAQELLGQVIAQKLLPNSKLKVTSVEWTSFDREVIISLEAPPDYEAAFSEPPLKPAPAASTDAEDII